MKDCLSYSESEYRNAIALAKAKLIICLNSGNNSSLDKLKNYLQKNLCSGYYARLTNKDFNSLHEIKIKDCSSKTMHHLIYLIEDEKEFLCDNTKRISYIEAELITCIGLINRVLHAKTNSNK